MISQEDVHVLIAEDDYLVSEMIKGLVEKIGYSVVGEAFNGLEAVTKAQSLRPDVILMDIKMPDMDGIEAARRIYESRPTPIVVLTAYETPELVRKASAAGVGAYVIKPSNEHELERAITIALARFNDMMELRRKNVELQDTLSKVKQLSGLLPICYSCKKIRDEKGEWLHVDVYIRDHAEVQFSHGLCPDCMKTILRKLRQGNI